MSDDVKWLCGLDWRRMMMNNDGKADWTWLMTIGWWCVMMINDCMKLIDDEWLFEDDWWSLMIELKWKSQHIVLSKIEEQEYKSSSVRTNIEG